MVAYTHVEVRGELSGVNSILPLCRFQESNSDHQAWCQAPLPNRLSCQPSWQSYLFPPRMFAVLEMQPGILNMLGKRPATEPHPQRSIEIQIGILREASPGSEIYRVSR